MRSNRFWLLLFGGILVVCLVASALVLRQGGGTTACIYQDGVLVRTVDLSAVDEPYTFAIEGPAGVNTVEVDRGKIRVARADCPDQVCVHQGWITTGVAPIVCLPNALVIRLENAPSGGIDGVAG